MRFRQIWAVFVLLLGWCAGTSAAQTPAAPAADPPFGIMDNSFLVEEAFNQERGIFQNISTFRWQRGEWLGSFTQEWPAPSIRHQLSFTVPFGRVEQHGSAIGDVLINYRLQLLEEGAGRPAFSPRISLILPSSPADSGLGSGVTGLQVNLPLSKRSGDWYFHWNAGTTYFPGQNVRGRDASALISPFVAASVIWQASSTLNLLIEVVGESNQALAADGSAERSKQFTVSPGFRHAWNPSDRQVVVGLAAPIARSESRNVASLLAYFSYELPFK